MVKCTESCLDPKLGYWRLHLELAPSASRVLAPRYLTHMHKYEPRAKGTTYELCKCNMMQKTEIT
jgi:hypothetical protein